MKIDVPGFLEASKKTAAGDTYTGRLTLPKVQWTGTSPDLFATATLTAEQVADAAESRLLWTDQSVQRGITPTAPSSVDRELALANGYPEEQHYIFDSKNADEMTTKILNGDRLFLNPLIWNLRPGQFEAYWSDSDNQLFIYSGKIYLPDSHHRHQALLKAVRAYRDHPSGYPNFNPSKQFKIELYLLTREDEGNYFFDKNQRPKPTAMSKAYDLSTEDDLSSLAKRVLDLSPRLDAGVNRATDRLNKKAPHFLTLSTLREVMRTFAGSNEVEETELEGLAVTAAEFFEMLASVREELRVETTATERDSSLASAAVMMHGYAALMRDYSFDLGKYGRDRAKILWRDRLATLAPNYEYSFDGWTGDYLSKLNPLWAQEGIVKENRETHRITVSNTGGARRQAARALRRHFSSDDTAVAIEGLL